MNRPLGDAGNMQQGGLGWLRARAGKLTGTDASIPEEKNPFKTKDQWVREKVRALHGAATGEDLSEFVMTPAVRHGSAMESMAIRWYEKNYGFKIAETGLVTHPVYGWMAASPDGLKGVSSGIEVKCPFWAPSPYSVFDNKYAYYLWQCHMVMECCDLEDLIFICYLQKSPKDKPRTIVETVKRNRKWLQEEVPSSFLPKPTKGKLSRLDLFHAWFNHIQDEFQDPVKRQAHLDPVKADAALILDDSDLNKLHELQVRLMTVTGRISGDLEVIDLIKKQSDELKKVIADRHKGSVTNGFTTVSVIDKRAQIDFRKAFEYLGGEEQVLKKGASIEDFRKETGTRQIVIKQGGE
jgi:putative phage-type endonuclease